MSVKKKTVLLALMLAGVMGLSGCKTWDVVCDILAVGTTKVEKDDGPKVDLEGETPEVKDDDSTDLETVDSKTTFGNDEKKKDTKKNTTKGSDRTDKKRVTMPSGTPEPSHTTTPTPTTASIRRLAVFRRSRKMSRLTGCSAMSIRRQKTDGC